MMRNLQILALCVLCALATSAFAAKEYYSFTRSIRAHGMGGAFYALSDDEYALFYNPAGLAQYRTSGDGNLAFRFAASPTVSDLAGAAGSFGGNSSAVVDALDEFQGKPVHVGAGLLPYFVTKNFAFGLLLADTKVNFALLGRELDSEVDVTAISDSGAFLSFAHSLFDPNLFLGITAKAAARVGGHQNLQAADLIDPSFNMNSALNPQNAGGFGIGIDFDLGAVYDFPSPILGAVATRASLVFNNLLASTFPIAKTEPTAGTLPTLPRLASLGMYNAFEGFGPFDNIHLLVDFAEVQIGGEGNPDLGARSGVLGKHINFGIEAPINGWLVPRIGFHQGNFSAGLGINGRLIKLDFATYAEELGNGAGRLTDRRYEVLLKIGWSAPPPAPILAKTAAPPTKAPEKPKPVAPTPTPAPTPAGNAESEVKTQENKQ